MFTHNPYPKLTSLVSAICVLSSYISSAIFRYEIKANKNYKNNAAKCKLYGLPHELILLIAKTLDDTDKLCFAFAIVKICRTLIEAKRLPTPPIPEAIRSELRKRLKRDAFYSNSSLKFWRPKFYKQMWCVSCAYPHFRTMFPEEMLDKARMERQCFAATDGVFRLCQHKTFTFDEARSAMPFFDCRACFGLPDHFYVGQSRIRRCYAAPVVTALTVPHSSPNSFTRTPSHPLSSLSQTLRPLYYSICIYRRFALRIFQRISSIKAL
jgi:hypothetical protein